MIHIRLTSVLVADQQKALEFYTGKLGFVVNQDVPMGEYRWLTVCSPDPEDKVELLLEPIAFAPAAEFQKALFAQGIPAVSFEMDDLDDEYERMVAEGVRFGMKPTRMGPVRIAQLDDTCGNYVQLIESDKN